MEYVMLVPGLAIALAVFLIYRSKAELAYEKGEKAQEAKIAALTERLQNREIQIAELKSVLDRAAQQTSVFQSELQSVAGQRAAAEEKASRVPQLELQLKAKEEQLQHSFNENSGLKARLSAMATQLHEERKATDEKLAILDAAHAKLSDAFKSLSAEALNTNNKAFIDLAKASLEKFQEGAKGDLALRQQAINEMVKPMRDSLEKVDSKDPGVGKDSP